MFKAFFLKEISMGIKSPMLYIFFFIFTIIAAIGVVNDNIVYGGAIGNVLKNAPHIMSIYIGNMSIFSLLIATAYFNNAALRDYQNQFDEILFSTPIHKASYFFGRFFGALFLSTIPLLGVFFGFLIGSDMGPESGMINPDRVGDLKLSFFINNYFLYVLPNMFVSGAIIYAIALKWKSTIISFIATVILIIGYLVAGTFLTDISTEYLAAFTDILGVRAYQIDSKYFTSVEKNTNVISVSGWLFANRILWVGIGLIIIVSSYVSFSFIQKSKKVEKEKKSSKKEQTIKIFSLPKAQSNFNFTASRKQFTSFFKINFYAILKSNTFKIMLIVGTLILINKLLNGFDFYGVKSYHVTYKMLDFNRPICTIIGMVMLVFFSGELVWRERSSNISGVIDGLPHSSIVLLFAKITSLIAINVIFDLFLILISIGYQLLSGYTNPDIDVYLLDFIYSGLLLYIAWSCILVFIQIIINHKYISYFISILLLFLFEFVIVDALGIESFMLNLGFTPNYQYSDMNGFSEALISKNWFSLYWLLFGLLLITIGSLLWIRGAVRGIKDRIKSAKKHFTKKYALILITVVHLFVLTSSFVYYNTQIINPYTSANEIEEMQVFYEKNYKKYENIPQPRFGDVTYEVDIYPEERNLLAKTHIALLNKTNDAIDFLHYSISKYYTTEKWDITLNIPNAKLVLDDKKLGYQIYKLNTPLQPGSEMNIVIDAVYKSEGFENSVSNLRVAKNGTFIQEAYILPKIGYDKNNELMDQNVRKKYNFPPRKRMTKLSPNDQINNKQNYFTEGESDWVNIETIVSTSSNQIAIAPGTLVKQWKVDGRSYFKYRNDHSSLNFVNFMSAEYEVSHKKWNGIDIEVYYHKDHDYNIDMMLDAIEKSLKYYTENFGPYVHNQARIIEIPRYYNFAQAFPGTMPYTEGGGFTTDLSNKNDNNVIEAIIAHEMAHQYWAHQVVGANMQGATMLSESFSEYSALMVMKNRIKDDSKMKQFLNYDYEKYLKGRSAEAKKEMPLYKVEGQSYIHYGKGSVVLYALQDYIGEEKMNTALKNFLDEYKYKESSYPTTHDFLRHLKPQVPDSLNYLITDWIKEITLYDYRLKDATYKRKGNGKYEVSMDIEASKIKVDGLGTETKVKQHDWVDIGVYADTEEKRLIFSKRVLFTDEKMNFSFEIDTIPAKAAIDPKRLLIERVIDDNVKEF
ncbi:M1 family aminopeptidase [Aquimarina macrocephali]|uniref:M1 family aminopeptidase n=1 Tax=Aquimarina macrocephali TaxID=666563 RepID=UPI0004637783|nr:M1 family aminopeptidase [Aquimarina macrocephali]